MCGSNPEVAPEVNKAKCFAGCALGFGIVTLLGFGIPGGALVSSIGGLLGLIAGSMLCCCGPKSKGSLAARETTSTDESSVTGEPSS